MISPKIIRLPQCSPFSECIAAMHQNIKMSNIHKITNTWYPFDIALNLSNNVKRFTSSLPIGYTSVPQNEQKDESSAICLPHYLQYIPITSRAYNHRKGISDSLLWSFWAKSFWVRFFAFRTSLMRSAILNLSSNSAFCSSGIAARLCLNKTFCIIIVNLINCLCLYCWSFHSGSSCQLPDGKPMAAMLYFIKKNDPRFEHC